MKKYLIIQGAVAAVIMFAGASMASANYYPAVSVNGNHCSASSTVLISNAEAVANYLQMSQTQQSQLLSPANLYIYSIASQVDEYGGGSVGGLAIALCLQPGYVTNVPSGINTVPIFNGTASIDGSEYIRYYQASTSPYVAYPSIYNQGNTMFVAGIVLPGAGVAAAQAAAMGTSSVTYSVSVDYDKFTAEAAQYGYQSVYTTTGTKTVAITIFKFNDSSTMTTAQVIAKLAGLGYRPATLSELYAVATQAGNNVVGLGTNLESGYGYPYTGGTGGAGMGHSNGPFSTSAFKFAAVQN